METKILKQVLIVFLLCIFATTVCRGQDVIVTKDSKRIDAKVEEISSTEIKYRRQENPNGPLFVINTEKISSIIFGNGDVKSFETTTKSVETKQKGIDSNNDYPVVISKEEIIQYTPFKKMEYKNGFVYGGVEMDDDAYEKFLKRTCPIAYNKYELSEFDGIMAWVTLDIGLPLFTWGVYNADKEAADPYFDGHSTALMVSGGISLLCSLLFVVGKYRARTKSVELFNQNCSTAPVKSPTANLSFYVSPISTGITLSF